MDSHGELEPWLVVVDIPAGGKRIELPRLSAPAEVHQFVAAVSDREPTWAVTARRLEPEEALILGLYHLRPGAPRPTLIPPA